MSYRNQPPALNLYSTNVAMGNYREQSPASSDESSLPPPDRVLIPDLTMDSIHGDEPAATHFLEREPTMPRYIGNTTTGVKIRPMDKELLFDGVKLPIDKFIKRYESAGKTDRATATDLAEQILPFIKGDLKEEVEEMPGYVAADWETLKKNLLNRFGQALPLVKHTKQDLKNLVASTAAAGGVKTLEHFKIFRTKFETITHYLVRMGYSTNLEESRECLLEALSSDLESAVTRELIRDNRMKASKDGGDILPDTQTLIKYIHREVQAVSVLARRKVYRGDEKTSSNAKQQAHVIQQTRAPALNPVDDLAKTLSSWNVQRPPGFVSASHVPYRPAQYEKPPAGMKCHYCFGDGHTPYRCNLFQQDEFERKVYRDGRDYKLPNGTAVHFDRSRPVKAVVERYAAAAAGPPVTPGIINLPLGTQVRKDEPAAEVRTSYGKLEECEPEKLASYEADMAKRLRNGKETEDLPKVKKTCRGVEEDMDVDEDILAIANNDYDQFPGYKELQEEISAPKKVQFKDPEPQKTKEKPARKSFLEKTLAKDYPEAEDRVVQRMVGEGRMELSYGEIFAISNGVTEAFKKKISRKKVLIEDKVEKTTNTGGLESDEESEEGETNDKPKRSHYACPLGYIKIGINNKEVQALLDNGSMVNVLPKELAVRLGLIVTERSMNLKGIGGHKNEILGIAEGVRVRIGNIKRSVHFWVSSGDVQPILGKPFLIDVSASMKYVKAGGETLSINDDEGRTYLVPIITEGNQKWETSFPTNMTSTSNVITAIDDASSIQVFEKNMQENQTTAQAGQRTHAAKH
ncbi:hypothetical protein PSHT_12372 [Puccinia striiformis]|uniref:Peptidase A2 domain-containing protein n=1 Tax=Puccinia striiformis TaxID=27350 RepID=A0A2S4UWY5_9BASI|nr:hypothetical protein PSHT_12372 [Puccinia striiformis]